MITSFTSNSARNTPTRLALLGTVASLVATLAACDGDSRPFEEQAEVLTLDLVSVDVVGPPNITLDDAEEADIVINQDQQIELGLIGRDSDGSAVDLDSADRRWSSNDTSVVSVDDNGVVTGQEDGTAIVTVEIDDIGSSDFTFRVEDAELVAITSIVGEEELERCVPLPYYSVGVFEGRDGNTSTRTLFDVDFSLSQSSSAIIDDANQSTIRVNANLPGSIELIAQSGSAEPFSLIVTVLDTLERIGVSPNSLFTDVDDETSFTATGFYNALNGTTAQTTVDITDNIDWVVVESSDGEGSIETIGDNNPGEFTAEEEGTLVVQAFCGEDVNNIGFSVTVDIDEEDDDEDEDDDDDDV